MSHVDYTWNPFTGCTFGCSFCYARALYKRFGKFFKPRTYPERLDQPRAKKKPSVIFCGSTGDIAAVRPDFIIKIFDVMTSTPQHQYLILTKRPEEALARISAAYWLGKRIHDEEPYIPKNLWFGISATNQEELKSRWKEATDDRWVHDKFAGRVVSLEPLLEPVDFVPKADWIICGSKSPGKPIHETNPRWLLSYASLCESLKIPFLYKQGASHIPQVGKTTYNSNPMREKLDGK
jgi:protein gp37